MYELVNLEKEEYENFVKNSKKSHFLQSYAWGEFEKKERNLTPYYLGLKKDKKISQCITLIFTLQEDL